MQIRRVLPALLALTIAAGCGGGGDDQSAESTTSIVSVQTTTSRRPDATTTTTEPAAPKGVTLRSTRPDIEAEVQNLRLVRLDDTAMALQFELAATGDEPLGTLDSQLSENDTSFRPVAVYLFDPPRSAVYVPSVDAGETVIGTELANVKPGDTLPVTILYAAPPADVTLMAVVMPTFEAGAVTISSDADDLTDDPVLDRVDDMVVPVGGDPAQVVPATATVEAATPGGPTTVSFALPGDVLFEFGSADLSAAALATLDGVVDALPDGPGTLVVAGHTDSIGDEASNQVLSEQRANAVATELQGRVESSIVITAVGYGETQPLAPNEAPDGSDDPDGRARNRRVDITFTGTATTASSGLAARDLGHMLADAGLTVKAEAIRRTGNGVSLVRFRVDNPGAAEVDINADSEHFADIQDGLCHLSVLDTPNLRRTYPFSYWGVTSNDFCLSTLDATVTLAPGDSRDYFAAVPEPLPGVTSVTLEVPSFGLIDVPVTG